jgi:hypothetical protein
VIDVSEVNEKKKQDMAAYRSVFSAAYAQMLQKIEPADRYYEGVVGVEDAEIFRHRSPVVIE